MLPVIAMQSYFSTSTLIQGWNQLGHLRRRDNEYGTRGLKNNALSTIVFVTAVTLSISYKPPDYPIYKKYRNPLKYVIILEASYHAYLHTLMNVESGAGPRLNIKQRCMLSRYGGRHSRDLLTASWVQEKVQSKQEVELSENINGYMTPSLTTRTTC